MTIKTIFLDRDGVINKEVGYLHKIEDFKFIDGIFDACLFFLKLNYQIIIVTNQSGIARGYFNHSDYQKLTQWMLNQFFTKNISILGTYYCPHGPESICSCRKPMPGMFFEARDKFNINMEESWMIGDSETDIEAAINAGILNTILIRNGHLIDELSSNSKFIINSIKQSEQIIKS
jgi:D-glycero-D-manno-heptose 1,7-bisphosphate phosphatase